MNVKDCEKIKTMHIMLAAMRVQIGMHQTDVSEYLDVNNRMISAYENGWNNPDIFEFSKLCKLYGIPFLDANAAAFMMDTVENKDEIRLLQWFRRQPDYVKNMIHNCLCNSSV